MAKRIVINFDPSGQPVKSKPRRRWPRVLALVALFCAVVVALAGVAAFLWWRHYQSTPAYSLALLVDAAQRNDTEALGKRIDDDEIAKNMIANVNQKAVDRYGLAMNATVQQRIDKSLPSLLPRLKQTIHDEVTKEIKSFASNSEAKPFVFLLITVPSLVTITTEGDLAKASLVSNGTIELTMRRDADRWKLTELKDDAVVQRLVDSVMKELPAVGSIDPGIPLFKKTGRSRKRQR